MVYLWYQMLIILQLLKLSILVSYHRPYRLGRSHKYNSLKNRQSLLSRSVEKEPEGTDSIEGFLSKELNGIRKPRKSKSSSSKKIRTKTRCLKCKTNIEEFYLRPAFSCDEWNLDSGTCFLDRNVGATITLALKFGTDKNHLPSVVWKQEFHLLSGEKTKEFMINPDTSPWNIVIGNKGYEFRISPITEQDVDFNYFSVNLAQSEKVFHPKVKKLNFRIRIVPINLGFLYLGETITLNIDSFISLPAESIKYRWYVEKNGERGTLPSNMKKSLSGRVLTISELRKNQEGIVACSIYSNLNVSVAKRRFLIKHISKGYESALLSNVSNRKSRHLEIEEGMKNIFSDMDKRKSDSNYSKEGFEMPKITIDSSGHLTHTPTSIYQNKYLMNQLSKFQINPELADYNKMNHPPLNIFKPQHSFKPYGEEILDDDESSTTKVSENDQSKVLSKLQNPESFNYFSMKQSFKDADEISTAHPNEQKTIEQKPNEQKPNEQTPNEQKPNEQKPNEQTPSEQTPNEQKPNGKKQKSEGADLEDSSANKASRLSEGKERKSIEDSISKLISECNKNTQCSIHATCINQYSSIPGFCRCDAGFQGNGVSCWEGPTFTDSD
ncbi:uncharacterized protein [Parasteatoda tepidariorum]|uniref:uncharacterized protein isoform X1 n=1 Tax=Parasteatoda tepidariorum TaxID=114398 RepID=UPI001C71BD04|nr:uncharacterized protein LOC107456436 [Parasteatoda tepidariorum]